MLNAGHFKHKITIQRLVTGRSEQDFPIEEWHDVKKLYAMIITVQGREYFRAAETKSQNDKRFVIRYCDFIDSNMRIFYKGKYYEIIAPPINDNELNITLTLIGREVS